MARPRLISDEQILSATRAAVREHGSAVSLDAVAALLGVSQPALLKRFGTRKGLLIAALRPPVTPPFLRAMEHGPDERPFREQLAEMLGWFHDFFEEQTPCLAALRESGIPMQEVFPRGVEPLPLRVHHATTAWLERAAAKGLIAQSDFDTIAFTMFSAVSARSHLMYFIQRSPTRSSTREFMASIVQLFDRALGARPNSPTRVRRSRRARLPRRVT